ncbi:ABC-type transport system involved in multi-copper enzyme maturation%2C permease component [Chlamydia trachomatis]|nr:ABC-type transport system involved in multi-copper enzyme maturation%2C permease component [Chlamydia trachomatis]
MLALLKIEWIKTWREWPTFIMAIGMPVGFFLFYSGMTMFSDPVQQKAFIQSYMLTMTAFSMSSFGFFSFPFMLVEDRANHWLAYLVHSPIAIWQYYASKVCRVLLYFACSITVTFLFGALFRGVHLSLERWLGSIALLLVSSLIFLAFGLLISQIKSQQVMSIVANIAFLGLAIIGGSWMPIEAFPGWLQSISKWTPLYHVNQFVVQFAQNGSFLWKSFASVIVYAIIIAGLALWIKGKTEVK